MRSNSNLTIWGGSHGSSLFYADFFNILVGQ